jgi:hypothetical protein
MKKTVISSIVLVTIIAFNTAAQSKNSAADSTSASETVKTEVVVNMKMIEQYRNFMENGEYVSLAETIKNYDFNDFKGFYATYRNYEFDEETSYDDIKLSYEKGKNEQPKDGQEKPKEANLLTDNQE